MSKEKEEIRFASVASNRSVREWIVRLLILIVGLFIAHLGVSLFLLSNTGSNPFTILVQGIALSVGLSIGTIQVIILIAMMIVMHFFTKGYVKIGTVICAFIGGWQIDFYMWLLKDVITAESSWGVKVASMVAGCVILSLGMAMVIMSDAGTGPNDLFAIILSDKVNSKKEVIQFRWVRVMTDAVFTVAGFLLGGVVGPGTIVSIFLTGPVVQFFLPPSKRMTDYLVGISSSKKEVESSPAE